MPLNLVGMTSFETYDRYCNRPESINLNFDFATSGSLETQLKNITGLTNLVTNLSQATVRSKEGRGCVQYGIWGSNYPRTSYELPETRRQAMLCSPFVFKFQRKYTPSRIRFSFVFDNKVASTGHGNFTHWAIGIRGEQTQTVAMPVCYIDFATPIEDDGIFGLFYNEGKTRMTDHIGGYNHISIDLDIENNCPDSMKLIGDNASYVIEWYQARSMRDTRGSQYGATPIYFEYFQIE